MRLNKKISIEQLAKKDMREKDKKEQMLARQQCTSSFSPWSH